MNDSDFMRRAIELAKLGKGFTNPNPLVGAVIVRDGKILAEGYHHKCGELHAERDALKNAKENGIDVAGSTIYVTLEPCCHHGRQPPCTEAIIQSGIKKVVIGSRDPNSLVNGKGVEMLRNAGIEVVQDFLKEECDEINPIFFYYIQSKIPYVIVKYAMTMDGQTSTSIGESKWITGEKARENVHKTRSEVMAVMTGIGTVLKDNPMLNVRLEGNHRQPLRVILDSKLKISLDSNLVKTAKEIPVIVFCSENLESLELKKKSELENLGVKVETVEENLVIEPVEMIKSKRNSDFGKLNHHSTLNTSSVLKKLGSMGIDSVLVESGGSLNGSLFFESDVNEVHVYIAPKIFGNDGKTISSPVRGLGIDFPKDAKLFSKPDVEFFGEDILLKYKRKF